MKGTFSQEAFDAICDRIAQGESLRAICRDKNTPGMTTVFKWLGEDENLAKQYARAREAQADADADRIGDIAAKVEAGALDPQAARVAIDALKWTAGKRKPKVYGDKTDLTIGNPDGSPISFTTIIEKKPG